MKKKFVIPEDRKKCANDASKIWTEQQQRWEQVKDDVQGMSSEERAVILRILELKQVDNQLILEARFIASGIHEEIREEVIQRESSLEILLREKDAE